MTINVPSAGHKGYELIEWYNEIQKHVNQRIVYDYQVAPADQASITGSVNMTLGASHTGIRITQNGNINLPIASLNRGKIYWFEVGMNPNVNFLTWTPGTGAVIVPAVGDTIGFQSSLPMALLNAAGTDLSSRADIFIVSDGISNWVVYR